MATFQEKNAVIKAALELKSAIFELENASKKEHIEEGIRLIPTDVKSKLHEELRCFELHKKEMDIETFVSILKKVLEEKKQLMWTLE